MRHSHTTDNKENKLETRSDDNMGGYILTNDSKIENELEMM